MGDFVGLEKPVIGVSSGTSVGLEFSNVYMTNDSISANGNTYLGETPSECYAFMAENGANNFALVKIKNTEITETVHANSSMDFERDSDGFITFYNKASSAKTFVFGYFY